MSSEVLGSQTPDDGSLEKRRHSVEVHEILLQPEEIGHIEKLIEELLGDQPLPDDAFFDRATLMGQELPNRIRQELYRFKRYQPYPGIIITGFPVNDEQIGPTPLNLPGRAPKTYTSNQRASFTCYVCNSTRRTYCLDFATKRKFF